MRTLFRKDVSVIAPGKTLEWIQESVFKKRYLLQSEGETVATLVYPRFLSSEARAESSGGCWVFRQAGLWRSKVEILQCDHDLPFAMFVQKSFRRRGTLQLPLGRMLSFGLNIWGTKATITTDKGELLLTFKMRGIVRARASVEVQEHVRDYPESAWIVCLAWYLILAQRRRRAQVAG